MDPGANLENNQDCTAIKIPQQGRNGFSNNKRRHEDDVAPCSKKSKNEKDELETSNHVVKEDCRAETSEDRNGLEKLGKDNKVDVNKTEESVENVPNLVMFPDDVLLIILSYLDHVSLLRLNQTCTLFARLTQDYTLWRNVDFSLPAASAELEFIASKVREDTETIKVHGRDEPLPAKWLQTICDTCPKLSELTLCYNIIDCTNIMINQFPRSLTSLDLSHTFLRNPPNGSSYFKDISFHIPNLKRLILSNCPWFDPHSLMAISKCKLLEELRVNDCSQVRECLAYCGLSTRGGFASLQTLDLRRCCISHSELSCFLSVQSLKNIYLEQSNQGSVFIDAALVVMCMNHMERVQEDDFFRPRPMHGGQIEKLVIRHYRLLQDATIMKIAEDALSLRYLDITGSGICPQTIDRFKEYRPEVMLVTDLDEHNF